jgi:hypothetical protein
MLDVAMALFPPRCRMKVPRLHYSPKISKNNAQSTIFQRPTASGVTDESIRKSEILPFFSLRAKRIPFLRFLGICVIKMSGGMKSSIRVI